MENFNRLNDVYIKFLLGSPERQTLTLNFIKAMIGEDMLKGVNSLIFIDKEQGKEQNRERGTIVDIMAMINNGTTVHIEVQVAKDKNIFPRCLLYWSKQYGKELTVSETYDKLKPLVSIILCNYNRDDGNKRYYNRYHIYNDVDKRIATNHFDMVFIELTKFKIKDMNHLTDSDRWLAYLANKGNEKERRVIMDSEAMKEVQDAESRFLGDRALYNEYLRREFARRDKQSQMMTAYDEGKIDGKKEGIEIGALKERKLTVQCLMESNHSLEDISVILKRPIDEIRALINS